jgi:hypothetical protein
MKAMAQAERSRPASANEFFQIGANRFESLMQAHKELLDTFERAQRDRLARAMEETRLASEFAAKVAGARSIPEVMAIYQEWMARCAQLFDEDGRKFLDDSQKVANAALSLLSNGQRGGST